MRWETTKRDAILAATKELLWERGYQETSPNDVLTRSGAGQGSLYHHFPRKLDLARTALAEMAAEELAAMETIFASTIPPLERVQRYLRRERVALRGCRLARLANETAMEIPEFREPIGIFLGEIERRLASSLKEAQASDNFCVGIEPEILATTLVAVIEGGFVLARVHWDEARMRCAIDGMLRLLQRAGSFPAAVN